jgi:aryl-alcohol dehydrogenase-like predicted oxidoreductase
MDYRPLGKSGLLVSPLTLGTMTFGGLGRQAAMGHLQVEDAARMIDRSLEIGINLIDTGDVYSQGLAEEILGKALGSRRKDVLVASKLHQPMGDGPNDVGQSRYHIIRACEDSLRRLGTDYIDLYQVHSIDELTPMEESLRALDDLVRQGKVRYIGCSNHAGWHLMKALATSERHNLEPYVSLQAYYSLVARDLEAELLPLCLDQGVGVLVWSPLAAGFLAGKQRRGQARPEEGTRRAALGDHGAMDLEQGFDILDVLEEIASEREVTIPQVALNWLIHRRGVTSVILGARNLDQFEDNLHTATWNLTEGEMARLNAVSARPVPYPYWHQQRFNRRLRYVLS